MADNGSKLESDLASHEFRHGVEQHFWELVEKSGLVVYIRLFASDDRSYLGRFTCVSYGDEPIDCKFVDDENRECVASAWPRGDTRFEQWIKFKPEHLFICWDQDATAINNHHQDWRQRKAWTKSTNQIVAYLNFLRKLLHLPENGYSRQPPSIQP